MGSTLKLYKEVMVNGTSVEAVPFPNEDHQAMLADYKYSASRMSNAPSITATLNYPTCLDAEWSDRVYVEFRGEKYYIKGVPSSSHDNNSNLYKHNLEFTSERIMLDSVYFFDVVQENSETDKPVANSADFSFYGTVKEFAERLNRSMLWSGIGGDGGYKVVIDSGVEFKDAMYTASNQYISDALKSMYETYELPYYFVGKEIHIGYAEKVIEDPLKYGAKNSLISVGKNYTNDKIINRITGTGSDKNITYYYPNPTPKGHIGITSHTTSANLSIEDDALFASKVEEGELVSYKPKRKLTPTQIKNISSDTESIVHVNNNGELELDTHAYDFRYSIGYVSRNDSKASIDIDYKIIGRATGAVQDPMYGNGVVYARIYSGNTSYILNISGGGNSGNISYLTSEVRIPSGLYTLEFEIRLSVHRSGTYFPPSYATVDVIDNNYSHWVIGANNNPYSLKDIGIKCDSGTPVDGDSFELNVIKRINVQAKLMPSLYRETDGEERFYIAENDKYKDEEGNDIVFKRPYSKDRPKEYILNNDEIFPTIEGMTNASGLRIDMFSEFAYDKDDNDEIYPEDYENSNLASKYKHPYFFGKLRKFNGEHGFNLFDHAIEGGEMTFSFKTGKVGGCNFKIGVDEDEGKYNLVQVYEVDTYEDGFGWHRKGELKRDENGNVLSGYAPNGGSQTPQACQQDTVNNEVWIALKKDVDTFGVLMPNAENSYKPSTEDTFVIINIDLPEAYVTAAEKRLEDEIIKHMSENNDYKFTFSAKLSRIFFAENEQFASELNENSKVSVEYDGVIYPMYVSSYSYTAKGSEILPEVSIELNDEIKIFKGALARVKNEFKFVLGPTVDKIDIKLKETSNSLSSTTRIAKVANETATAAKTSSDELKVEIKDVGAVANGAKLSAENAQLSATQAKEGITAVGNEVGSLKTTVTSTQNIASNAQLTANNAMSEIGRVSNETYTKFNSIDNSITGIEKDVNALEGLIGDEYNIWFENEGQQGREPTLGNYPASDWTSDDDYFNHDKDLYYSITLGRAWRFMYNDGDPFWEEITDADTISALTKAQEALKKAEEAAQAVKDLDYLKDVFGESTIMNEHAVTLSKLLAVTDDDNNVVAGMYGGDVDALNDNFEDAEHGTLMFFAGANSVQEVKEAKHRVYEDGTVYIKEGVFEGVIQHRVVKITKANIDTILPSSGTSIDGNTTYTITPMMMSAIMDFTNQNVTLKFTDSDRIAFMLPVLYKYTLYGANGISSEDELRGLVGTRFIVYNNTPAAITFCGRRYDPESNSFDSAEVCYGDWAMGLGQFAIVECKISKDDAGREVIYWDINVGRHKIVASPIDE